MFNEYLNNIHNLLQTEPIRMCFLTCELNIHIACMRALSQAKNTRAYYDRGHNNLSNKITYTPHPNSLLIINFPISVTMDTFK